MSPSLCLKGLIFYKELGGHCAHDRFLNVPGTVHGDLLTVMSDEHRTSTKAPTYTVNSKIIRALAIVLAIFLWFDCQILSSHACYMQYKA